MKSLVIPLFAGMTQHDVVAEVTKAFKSAQCEDCHVRAANFGMVSPPGAPRTRVGRRARVSHPPAAAARAKPGAHHARIACLNRSARAAAGCHHGAALVLEVRQGAAPRRHGPQEHAALRGLQPEAAGAHPPPAPPLRQLARACVCRTRAVYLFIKTACPFTFTAGRPRPRRAENCPPTAHRQCYGIVDTTNPQKKKRRWCTTCAK